MGRGSETTSRAGAGLASCILKIILKHTSVNTRIVVDIIDLLGHFHDYVPSKYVASYIIIGSVSE